MLAVVSIEGVLCQGHNLKTDPARRGARKFYDALASQYDMIALSAATPEIAAWWLRKEHFAKWAGIHTWPGLDVSVFDLTDWKASTLRQFLADGWEIVFYVDTNPQVITKVGASGIPVMLMSYPAIHPAWKDPSKGPRSWEEIAGTVEEPAPEEV